MKLSDWAEKQGIAYLTAYRWFKAGKLPVKAYQSESGTIIVQDDAEASIEPLINENNMNNDAMSLFLKKTVEFSKNNLPIEDFAAYILSTFNLQINYGPNNPKYSKNKPKSEDIQNHFKKFISKTEKPKVNIFVPNQESFDDLVAKSDLLAKEALVTEINTIKGDDSLSNNMNLSEEIPEIKDLYKSELENNYPRVFDKNLIVSYDSLGSAGIFTRSNLTPQQYTSTTNELMPNTSQPHMESTLNLETPSTTITFNLTGSSGATGFFKPTDKELSDNKNLNALPKRRGRKAKVNK